MGIPLHAYGGSGPSPSSLELARRLLAHDATPGGGREPQATGAALQRTCLRVFGLLRDSMGDDGCDALLIRALRRTEADHPALREIHRGNGSIHLDGVVASVEAHGVAPATAAVEALLASLIDVLVRLIGEDMAIRLIDHHSPRPRPAGGAQPP